MPEKKHTPIVSEAQRGFFGAELARKRTGKTTRTDMSDEELSRHLKESKGKNLPERVEKEKPYSYSKFSPLPSNPIPKGTQRNPYKCPECGGESLDPDFLIDDDGKCEDCSEFVRPQKATKKLCKAIDDFVGKYNFRG